MLAIVSEDRVKGGTHPKGPLGVEAVKRRVVSRTHRRQPGDEETLVVIRSRDRDQQEVVKVDYDLSNAVPETPLWECARVAVTIDGQIALSTSAPKPCVPLLWHTAPQ